MISKIIRLIVIYNLLLIYSFNFDYKKLLFYWKNIKNVKLSMDTDDFPYIKKFEMLYKLREFDYNCLNLEKFISNNQIPKIYPNISLKSIWTDEFKKDINILFQNINVISHEIKTSYSQFTDIYKPMSNHYGDERFKDDSWLSCQLIKDREINKNVKSYFYNTVKQIQQIKYFYGWAFISVLKPGTIIPRHRGRYNYKLTCHIGIDGLEGCKFIIDNKIIKWSDEKYFIFNDFSYHEVKHEGTKDRVVLILDLFHPEIRIEDIKAIELLNL